MTTPLGRYAGAEDGEHITVRLLQAPLIIWRRAAEHHDELMREMALMAMSPSRGKVPIRLLELVDLLGRRYGAAGGRADVARDAAMAAGLDRIDLSYEVPHAAALQAQKMRDLLDEVEEYCRTNLLTLAQPQVQADFSRWYINEFVQQCAGHPPLAWPGPWA